MDAVGQTTVYYTPCTGNRVPIYDGTSYVNTTFAELSLALDPTSGHTNYHESGQLFDCFVINDAGTIRLGTGPKWTTLGFGTSARGTGAATTELELFNGFWVNKNSIVIRFGSASGNTVTVPARQATFLGTIRSTLAGQVEDSQGFRYVWNAFNRVERLMFVNETAASWSYSTATQRAVNANSANRLYFVNGLAGDMVAAHAQARANSSAANERAVQAAIGLNSSTTPAQVTKTLDTCSNTRFGHPSACYKGMPPAGLNFLAWCEIGAGTDTQTWFSFANMTGLSGSVHA